MTPADSVSAYLDAGGDPTALAASLFDRGWISPTSIAVWTDIDNDGDLDFSAGLTGPPDAQGIALSGSVILWRCQGGSYLRSEIASARPDFGLPALREAQDLTGDGTPELLVAYPLCGAHSCFAQFAVFQWDGPAMADRFKGVSDDMPYPELSIEPGGPGAPAAIKVTATGIGSVGAGPYRIWSRTWRWEAAAQSFLSGEPVVEAPRYRIHALYDADDAFANGDTSTALSLYLRVIEDDSLLDWQTTGERRSELAAYAAYRRVLAFLMSGDEAGAQAEIDLRLEGLSGPAKAYAELAGLLFAADPARSLPEACTDVRRYVEQNSQAILDPLDHGYANRTYLAADICPMS